MVDKEKVVLLNRLAIYDKHISESDKKINDYFLHDYIYAKNIRTRFFAFIGSLIILAFYMLHRIFVEEIDLFALDYMKELTDAAVFIVIILVLYTLIGSLQASVTYRASQKRIRAYLEVLKRAGEMESAVKQTDEGNKINRYGRDIIYKSGDYQRNQKV